MKTLEDEEAVESSTTRVLLKKKTNKISLPNETIEDILSRLLVKSILRFRTLSKPWLRRISDPSFTKLHFTRPHRTSLFISAFRRSTNTQHLLSAAADDEDGGPVTHILTLDDVYGYDAQTEHLNGLVFFTCGKQKRSDFNDPYVFVVNPSTHKFFKIPYPYDDRKPCIRYFFGFDEPRNEHKILMIRLLDGPFTWEVMVFSLSNYSWRKIDVKRPAGFGWDYWRLDTDRSVCVNSVVHLMLQGSFDILAFDLRTEEFSLIKHPEGARPRRRSYFLSDDSFLVKINGCVGVVWYDSPMKNKKMRIWMLQDYENRVWVKETIKLRKHSIKLHSSFSVDSVNTDEIIFSSSKLLSQNVMSVHVYNKKTRCFKSLQFTPGHQFRFSKTLKFDQIRCYVESMLPL